MTGQLTRPPKNFVENVLDRIFAMRIFMHFPFSGILMLGYFYGLHTSSNQGYFSLFQRANTFNMKIFLSYLVFYVLMGGTYVVNQIVDRQSDLINRKNYFISDGHISIQSAVVEAVILYSLSLAFSLYLSLKGYFAGGTSYFYVILASVVLGLMYSVKPFRLNARPGLDMTANAFGYGFLNLSAGYLVVAPFNLDLVKISIPIVLIGLAGFGSTTIADIEGDKNDGKISIGVFLGEKKTYIFSIILYVAAFVLSLLMKNLPCLLASAIAIPAHVLGLLKGTKKSALVTMRISNAGLVLVSFAIFPVLIAAFLSVFLMTKFYYKKRFGIDYPSLTK